MSETRAPVSGTTSSLAPEGRTAVETQVQKRPTDRGLPAAAAQVSVDDLEQTLALLVELLLPNRGRRLRIVLDFDQRAREGFLGRLAVDLPGESDEDDIEYIDEFLKEGRGSRWGLGRVLLVVGGAVAVGVLTAGIGAALIAGGGAVAAGGAAVGAALASATAGEVAAAAAATVLVGAGGAFGTAVLTSEMSPELVDAAVLKRYALVRSCCVIRTSVSTPSGTSKS